MLTPADIRDAMSQLAVRRPVFHSEADFQHELAWEIRSLQPQIGIRLEYPLRIEGQKTQYIDIRVIKEASIAFIELKYIARKLPSPYEVEAELFDPKRGSGGRRGLVNDIVRIEAAVNKKACSVGYAILLTSARPYWEHFKSHQRAVLDLYEGTTIDRSVRCCEQLTGQYKLNWQAYMPGDKEVKDLPPFQYLVIQVGPQRDLANRSESTPPLS